MVNSFIPWIINNNGVKQLNVQQFNGIVTWIILEIILLLFLKMLCRYLDKVITGYKLCSIQDSDIAPLRSSCLDHVDAY